MGCRTSLIEKGYVYKTVFVDCDLEIANKRCAFRKNVNANEKILRNILFSPYYKNITEYYFIKDFIILNSSNSICANLDELIQFIAGEDSSLKGLHLERAGTNSPHSIEPPQGGGN